MKKNKARENVFYPVFFFPFTDVVVKRTCFELHDPRQAREGKLAAVVAFHLFTFSFYPKHTFIANKTHQHMLPQNELSAG